MKNSHIYIFTDASLKKYKSKDDREIVLAYGGFVIFQCIHIKGKCNFVRFKPIYEDVFELYGNNDLEITEAELEALIKCLEYLIKTYHTRQIVEMKIDIFMDHQSIVKALDKVQGNNIKITAPRVFKKDKYHYMHIAANKMLNRLRFNKDINVDWISSETNHVCNNLVNSARKEAAKNNLDILVEEPIIIKRPIYI